MSEAPHKNRRSGLQGGSRTPLIASIFFGSVVLLFAGCASLFAPPSVPPPVRESTHVDLISPRFTPEELKAGGLAVFAVLVTDAPEGFQQNAAYELFQGLRFSFPQAHIIPRAAAFDKVIAADRLQEYKAFVKSYPEKRRMTPEEAKKWGEIEGVRYLFIGAVDLADKHTESRMVQGRESAVAGKISVFASGPSMIPEEVRKRIALRGEIWDSQCGQAVWIGKGEAEVVEEAGKELVRVEDVFISAARSLTNSLARTVAEKPVSVAKGCQS